MRPTKTYPDFQALSLVWTKAHCRRSEASTARRRGAIGAAAASAGAADTGHDPESPTVAVAVDGEFATSDGCGTPSCGVGEEVVGDGDPGTE